MAEQYAAEFFYYLEYQIRIANSITPDSFFQKIICSGSHRARILCFAHGIYH
jgi:hypothetical protein